MSEPQQGVPTPPDEVLALLREAEEKLDDSEQREALRRFRESLEGRDADVESVATHAERAELVLSVVGASSSDITFTLVGSGSGTSGWESSGQGHAPAVAELHEYVDRLVPLGELGMTIAEALIAVAKLLGLLPPG